MVYLKTTCLVRHGYADTKARHNKIIVFTFFFLILLKKKKTNKKLIIVLWVVTIACDSKN
jgi:hypothetical protein